MRPRLLPVTVAVMGLLLVFVTMVVSAQGGTVHIVRPGETLSSIARLYSVSPAAIADANGLLNPNLIFVGQRLTIPSPGPGSEITHVVRPGETLSSIAWLYNVDPLQLATYNGLTDLNRIVVGQVLRIPRPRPTVLPSLTAVPPSPPPTVPVPTPMPPRPTPMPSPVGCACEEIVIFSPTRGMTVTSPVTVSGLGSGFEQTLVVTILDGSGGRIGQGPAMVVGPYGGQGAFTATVPFSVPVDSQLGRIQVWSESPRDGAIEHLSSVTVMLQGYDLDPLLERLDGAIKAKDYAALEAMMSSSFQLGLYKSDAASLPRSQAITQLRQIYLGPGAPRLDFSVDARKLLGDRVTFKPDVIHVVYSTGWGTEKADDAFLLIGDVGGRAAWSGMLYVPKAKIDYH